MNLNFTQPIDIISLCDNLLKLPLRPSAPPYAELDREETILRIQSSPPPHLQATLHYIVATQFDARAYEIFRMRYCGHKSTMHEIGDAVGISHERVRQILAKIHYALCAPYCLLCMRDGIEKTNRYLGGQMSHIESYRNGFNDGYQKGIRKLGEDPTLPEDILDTPTSAMTKLNTRSHNALARANIFTLRDIVENMECIPKLNCIGVTSIINIAEALEEYHIDYAALRVAAPKAFHRAARGA